MKEKNRAEEWFRAKHDELAGTARANLAAHDLEPGQEPTIWTASTMRPPNRWSHMPTASTSTGTRLWRTAASDTTRRRALGRRGMVDERARTMWDEVDDIPDDGQPR